MKNMRTIMSSGIKAAVLLWLMMCWAGCSVDNSANLYQGEAFVQFQDSVYELPVTSDGRDFDIVIGVTQAASYDRYVAVAVDVKASNAVEGYHFSISDHNVKIPAGQLTGTLTMKGKYENIESVNDSLAVTLRILNGEALSPLYSGKANVRMQKVRPFCIDDYVGDMQLTCTFPFSTSSVTRFYVKSERVDAHTLRICHPFDNSRNLLLSFHENAADPFDQCIDVREQVAFTDQQFGPVSMATVDGIPSYYLPEDRAIVLYMDAFLSNLGSFGSYYYILQWVSPDEVLANDNGLNTLW